MTVLGKSTLLVRGDLCIRVLIFKVPLDDITRLGRSNDERRRVGVEDGLGDLVLTSHSYLWSCFQVG